MDGPGENDPDLVPTSHLRFCEAIKTDTAAYMSLFTRTFQNKTFHVYRVKKKRKKSVKSSLESSMTLEQKRHLRAEVGETEEKKR